jgi:hypothetical protein
MSCCLPKHSRTFFLDHLWEEDCSTCFCMRFFEDVPSVFQNPIFLIFCPLLHALKTSQKKNQGTHFLFQEIHNKKHSSAVFIFNIIRSTHKYSTTCNTTALPIPQKSPKTRRTYEKRTLFFF